MSIHDLYHKIKGEIGLDNMTIMYLLVLVGVGIAAFGLGRLSVGTDSNEHKDISITQAASSNSLYKGSSKQSLSSDRDASSKEGQTGIEGNFVASKNGKLYYPSGCKGANRIKEENRVWFSTREDAESLGYTWATSCK